MSAGRQGAVEAERNEGGLSIPGFFLALGAGWLAGYLLGTLAAPLFGSRTFPWVVARAAGMSAYVLLELAVLAGLALSHPWRWGRRRPSPDFLYRTHSVLSLAALALVATHAVALALDPFVQVGWRGALLPGGAVYRTGPVAAGVLGAYLALLGAVSAGLGPAMARRWGPHLGRRLWLPLHRVVLLAWVLAWFHGVLAGSDTPALRAFYAVSGGLVVLLAATRYLARRPQAAASSPQTASWTAEGTVLRADGLGRQATGRGPRESSS